MATKAEINTVRQPFLNYWPADADRLKAIPNNLSSGILYTGYPAPVITATVESEYQPDPDGYQDNGPQLKSFVAQVGLEFDTHLYQRRNVLSTGYVSWGNQEYDFKTFGLYIHHFVTEAGVGIPANLHTYNQAQLTSWLRARPEMSNGTLNLLPKLQYNTVAFNIYARSFRAYLP